MTSPPHPVRPAAQLEGRAGVLELGETAQQLALVDPPAPHQVEHHGVEAFGVAEAVDRRHGGDDDRVRPLEERLRGGEAHLLHVLVDRGVLLDVGVGRRDVRLGLVVVVVGDEVLDRVAREELPHLPVELGGEGLVGREHQGRPLDGADDVRDGEGLSRPGHPEEGLVGETVPEPVHEGGDGRPLVAGGPEVRLQLEAVAAARAGLGLSVPVRVRVPVFHEAARTRLQ